MRDKNAHRKRLLALLLFAPVIAGCAGASDMFSSDLLSKDAEWFSRSGRLFIKNVSIETPPLTPNKPITARRSGQCRGLLCREWRLPAACQRLGRGSRRLAAANDHGNGGAWSHRMRRRARHWLTWQRQSVEQWAWRSGGGHQLYARPARRNLYLHGWTADIDRARAWRGGTAQARKVEEEAGGDLNLANRYRVAGKALVQPAASSYCELAVSQASSACCKALAAPARALLSWAACFGSR